MKLGAAQRRHGQLTATPAKLDTSWKLGFAAVPPPIPRRAALVRRRVGKSLASSRDNSLLVGEVLQRLFTHRLSVTQMMGPVGIARAAGEAAEMDGWLPKFGWPPRSAFSWASSTCCPSRFSTAE